MVSDPIYSIFLPPHLFLPFILAVYVWQCRGGQSVRKQYGRQPSQAWSPGLKTSMFHCWLYHGWPVA